MTEKKVKKEGKNKISTKVISVHTAVSAEDLVTHLMGEICLAAPGFLKILPTRNSSKEGPKFVITRHSKRNENTTCVLIYGINPEVVDEEIITNSKNKLSPREYTKNPQKLSQKKEQTNQTLITVNFLLFCRKN